MPGSGENSAARSKDKESQMPKDHDKHAHLYRTVTPDHLCPFGLKSKDLLERQGYKVEDH